MFTLIAPRVEGFNPNRVPLEVTRLYPQGCLLPNGWSAVAAIVDATGNTRRAHKAGGELQAPFRDRPLFNRDQHVSNYHGYRVYVFPRRNPIRGQRWGSVLRVAHGYRVLLHSLYLRKDLLPKPYVG